MFRSSLIVTLIVLIGSVLGFIVQILLAWKFGTGIEVESYLFALSTPTFLAGIISSVLSYTLVPRLIACGHYTLYQKRYTFSVLIGMFVLSIVIGFAGFFLGYYQIKLLPAESSIRSNNYISILITISWLIGACQIFLSCLIAILNANRSYIAGATLALFPYVGMILLLFFGESSFGITALPLGMFVGTLLAIFSGIIFLRRQIFPIQLEQFLWMEMRQLVISLPYTAVALTCFSSYAVVDAFWAPQAGQGALAILGYAQRLVIAFGNLAVAAPSAVLVPHFAELIQSSNFIGFRSLLLRTILVVGSIALAVAIVISIFSTQLIQLLFARGAFGKEEVEQVSRTLRYMMPGMITMLISVVSFRALFCLENSYKITAILGLSWTIVYFFTSGFFYQFGAHGIAIGYSLVWFLFFIAVVYVISKKSLISYKK